MNATPRWISTSRSARTATASTAISCAWKRCASRRRSCASASIFCSARRAPARCRTSTARWCRRSADASVQPASFAFNKANAAAAKQWINKYPKGREQSAIIPLLMLAQEQEGWVTKAAIEAICDMLGMPRIRGLEVATFYTQYQLNPVGTRAHIQVCGTTPCMLRGSEALMDVCRSKIHHDQFHT